MNLSVHFSIFNGYLTFESSDDILLIYGKSVILQSISAEALLKSVSSFSYGTLISHDEIEFLSVPVFCSITSKRFTYLI